MNKNELLGSENSTQDIDAQKHTLATEIVTLGPKAALEKLEQFSAAELVEFLATLSPAVSEEILMEMDDQQRDAIFQAAPSGVSKQWAYNLTFDEDSIGRILESPHAGFRENLTVADATERIRKLVRNVFITYGFIVDGTGKLIGVITMRDLLLSQPSAMLSSIMLTDPFHLKITAAVLDALHQVVDTHFPVYPVCDENGLLVGTVRGRALFEMQAIEISAQAGTMVGVEKEERLSTPVSRSLRFRHPWLQLNLLTAFVAAGVVGYFQSTIDKMVVLAVFLPVLAGQSGNTGCQSLAVTLRGLTLGEMKRGGERKLILRDGVLGLFNGALVGVSAGLGMFILAYWQSNDRALALGLIVFLAMIGSCIVSGVSGATIPLVLRKLGADPATASSIFLTTATDVASMGMFLGLARWLVV
ncbi:MAG TPA: magnesium transporter [Planctomycetaceae bacterium]|nr:magnesium transporter [Planctomycetaceae bacterium]